MDVDLSAGDFGDVQFENGQRLICLLIEKVDEDAYRVRIESGWYELFTRTGKRLAKRGARGDIVSFTPMKPGDIRASILPTEITP